MKQARTIIAIAIALTTLPAVAFDGGRGIDIALRSGNETVAAKRDVAVAAKIPAKAEFGVAGQIPDETKIVGAKVAILDPVSREPIF